MRHTSLSHSNGKPLRRRMDPSDTIHLMIRFSLFLTTVLLIGCSLRGDANAVPGAVTFTTDFQ
jgi:hypothetical protein